MIFDDIIYNSKTGQFFNKSGKEIGWVNGSGYMFITVGKKQLERIGWLGIKFMVIFQLKKLTI